MDGMTYVALLAEAARGDEAARARLLEELYPEVQRQVHALLERDYRTKNHWIVPLFSTGDIVQDLFLGLGKELCAHDPARRDLPDDEGSLRAFLAARIKNRIVDRMRFFTRQRRDARGMQRIETASGSALPVASPDPSPSTCASLEERGSLFADAFASLDAREHELWRLRYDEERPFDEIAANMKYKNGESARAAFRALRAKLAVRLRRLGIDLAEGGAS